MRDRGQRGKTLTQVKSVKNVNTNFRIFKGQVTCKGKSFLQISWKTMNVSSDRVGELSVSGKCDSSKDWQAPKSEIRLLAFTKLCLGEFCDSKTSGLPTFGNMTNSWR